MKTSQELHAIAEHCKDMSEEAPDEPARRRLERLAEGWDAVSETQAWLDGEKNPIDQPSVIADTKKPAG